MDRPDLSICIPTYNRSESVASLVSCILARDIAGLEVVVLDNGSTDDTAARLRALHDPRLSLHFNGENRGVLYNLLQVLERSRGRHSVLLLDKDQIDPAAIDSFRRFLVTHPGVGCGYCEYRSTWPDEAVIYQRGMEALRRVAYLGHHPTGYFFDMALLRSIDFTRRFGDFEFVGHFPFDFMFAELCLRADAGVYHAPIFEPERAGCAAKRKSIGTNAAKEDAFFSPRGRLKTAIHFSHHIETLPVQAAEKEKLAFERFLAGLSAATRGYRQVMASPELCAHYHIASRRVGHRELLLIALGFYRRFLAEAVTHVRSGSGMRTARFHGRLVTLLLQRLHLRRRSAPAP